VAADGTVSATVTVKNVGRRAGDEVVQLYLQPVDAKRPRALKELRGVERLSLQPGESRQVSFTVQPARDLAIYDEVKRAYAADPGKFELQIGASSADIRALAPFTVN
jgi:beta-glucosidase